MTARTGALHAEAGYGHRAYAAALAELGRPHRLEASGGWILERPIPGTGDYDAIGPYPLFACENWTGLAADLDGLEGRLVSLSLVADPLSEVTRGQLERWFDVVRPFKRHFVIDLSRDFARQVSPHHRRNARQALAALTVERCTEPRQAADDWVRLYAELVRRHGIRGAADFSPQSLKAQLNVPGAAVFRAVRASETVGMVVWYVDEDRAYYHLAAYSAAGYQAKASYALFWRGLEWLTGRARWANLGGAAGINSDSGSGLARFKEGWTQDTRPAYFCGRVLDRERYAALAPAEAAAYFPAYRQASTP